MAKLVGEEDKEHRNLIKVVMLDLLALDKFTQATLVILFLFIGVTPFIINNFQTIQQNAASGCSLNGTVVPVGTEFCKGASYSGQYCTSSSSFGTCQSDGTWFYTTCTSGTSCAYYPSSTNVSCLSSCSVASSPTPQPATPTPTNTVQPTPTPTSISNSCNSTNCSGHAYYACTSNSPPTCCDYTRRCSGSSCIADCHQVVATSYCGGCGPTPTPTIVNYGTNYVAPPQTGTQWNYYGKTTIGTCTSKSWMVRVWTDANYKGMYTDICSSDPDLSRYYWGSCPIFTNCSFNDTISSWWVSQVRYGGSGSLTFYQNAGPSGLHFTVNTFAGDHNSSLTSPWNDSISAVSLNP